MTTSKHIAQTEFTRRPLATAFAAVRDDIRERRAEAAQRKALARDLATYTSLSERAELDAILARNEGPDAEALRTLVSRQRAA